MPVLENGSWEPDLSPKQKLVYHSKKRFLLSSGPRLTGKTIAILHRLVRHAWENDGAMVGLVLKTTKTGKLGTWNDLNTFILNEWDEAGLQSEQGHDFEIIKRNKQDGSTRMHYTTIRNAYGTESKFMLITLEHDMDVEQKFLNTRFSALCLCEGQNYKDVSVFNVPIQQLRVPNIPYEEHLFCSDTNPPEEGTEHFLYDLFFTQRLAEKPPDNCETEQDIKDFREFQSNIGAVEFSLDDAYKVDPRQIRDLKGAYANDPHGWARFVDGKWVATGSWDELHFGKHFKPAIHVIGDTMDPDSAKWQILIPSKLTETFWVGWDTGDVNFAATIGGTREGNEGKSVFDIFDESVVVGQEMGIDDFVESVIEGMDEVEEIHGEYIDWVHWSDDSAEKFKSNTDSGTTALEIYNASGGRVALEFAKAAKHPGGVRKRVNMIRRLLIQERLFVSAKCFEHRKTLTKLRKSKKKGYLIDPQDALKHAFDSMSYPIFMESLLEFARTPDQRPVANTRSQSGQWQINL